MKKLRHFLLGTLRGRLILGVAAVHAVMMSLFIGDLTTRQRAMLLDRQNEEATALSKTLATSAAGWIAADDISGLQELVEAQRRYPEILFAILANQEGRVLAATDKSRQGLYMLDLPREARQMVFSGTPALVDVAAPAMIGGHHVGWARVGVGQKVADEKLAEITRGGVVYALAAILIGSIIAWFMGCRITRRLYAVQETINAVRSGNRLARSPIVGDDEAAVMAREFNHMLDALAERDVELRDSEAKTRSILDNIGIGVTLISPKMEILELNRRMREWFPAIDPGQHPICYRAFHNPSREAVCDDCPTCKTLQDGLVHEATMQKPRDGVTRSYRVVSSPILNASGGVAAVIEMVEDITEKLSLESQLRQAQKMESIGRLAGGVAHDFNNMLWVIIGRTEMALAEVGPNQPLFATLKEIQKAANRSADLTRQLLAFARKQTVVPKVLDLNETVEGMLKMLRRLIGEDIDLVWRPEAGEVTVKMDPSQIDQILANLCVNARDAIAGVGKVTIETRAVTFDAAGAADHPGVVPGAYVLLAVSDDGCGMDKETLDQMFEPFFTTKEVGKGTGLGLATVYGIVKQNHGFINVASEPGQGASFKIYLPRYAATTGPMRKESPAAPAARGHETLLLAEDEPAVLDMARRMLEGLGYRVLAASTPDEAIRLAREHAGEIRLLITDVVMPEMNGLDLAKNLVSLDPGIRCLFMSGYAGNALTPHGVLDEGAHYIQKPLSIQTLAAKVREALDGT